MANPLDDEKQSKLEPLSTDWPAHNYWEYDENGDPLDWEDLCSYLSSHPDCEYLENTDYEEKWVQQFFWSADQAAALSFGRSPDKVQWHEYEESMYGSSDFVTHLGDLGDVILKAQRDRILPEVIPATMYAQWAERNRLPFPPELAKRVTAFFAEVMAMANDRAGSAAGEVKAVRSSPRKERNLLGVIYALAWKHHRLGDLQNAAVAGNIENVINRLVEQKADFKIEAKSQRIAEWLSEAIDQLGPPPAREA